MSKKMNKTIIITGDAPGPTGPYSQATKFNNLVFISGQIAIDPKSGVVIEGGVKEQTKQIFENIKAILEAADSSLEKVLKITVYLRNMDFFKTVNEVFNEYLKGNYPARETVEVCRLPGEVDVEISAIAHT